MFFLLFLLDDRRIRIHPDTGGQKTYGSSGSGFVTLTKVYTSGTTPDRLFLVSPSTATCFKMYNFILEFLIEFKVLNRKNASNPLLLGKTACINVCAQAIRFPDKPVSKKCANHTFYVRRTVCIKQRLFLALHFIHVYFSALLHLITIP